MPACSGNMTNACGGTASHDHKRVVDDWFATTVNESCSAVGILFFAAGIYRIVEISQPLGWLLALATALILAEIVVARLKLALCGGLVSLLLALTMFGATLDATNSLPAAALATVAASLIYLARFKTPLVLTATSVALTGVYVVSNGAALDLASSGLMAACLLLVVETVQSFRSGRLASTLHRAETRSMPVSSARRVVASSSRRTASVYR